MIDFVDSPVPRSLDPTPETPQTPLDDIQIFLTGTASFGVAGTLIFLSRLVPATTVPIAIGICGGVIGLSVYGLLRGKAAIIKACVYGMCAALGAVAASWDYLGMVISNAGVIGDIGIFAALVTAGVLVCLLIKGLTRHAR